MLKSVAISGVHLLREGNYLVVRVKFGEEWIEIIREIANTQFDRKVEPSDIVRAYNWHITDG